MNQEMEENHPYESQSQMSQNYPIGTANFTAESRSRNERRND